ncbi:NAD(P)-dependent oxidoreductase [Priestia flexa]|uniref:NAD(P)-dependent oxidoreductase n=1 Tax=Priestia flexa TaxID=86664 RepID=UPI000554D9D5|nr:NAD(P)H-binding protein [Priestia flexa]
MKIAIIGATGKAGSLILKEALNRDLDVTAIVRNQSKMKDTKVPVVEKDLFDLTKEDLLPFDVIVDAFSAPVEQAELHLTSIKHLAELLNGTEIRLLVIGGAGSLYTDSSKTTQFKESNNFNVPIDFRPIVENMSDSLDYLRKVENLHWVYISPAVEFNPNGVRTGRYVLAGEILTTGENGKSEISYADYAIAMVDEIINKEHDKERISVRY